MLTDGIELIGSSAAENFSIVNGSSLPATGNNVGELFYLTSGTIGLYVYKTSGWSIVGSGSVWGSITGNVTDQTDLTSTFEKYSNRGIASGYVPLNGAALISLAYIGTGTKDSTTYLRGDGAWASITAAISPYDIAAAVTGLPTAGASLIVLQMVRAAFIPANAVGSSATAGTAGTVTNAVFILNKNGTQIGTVTFAAGSTTGVFSVTASSFAIGDIITLIAPSPQNATLANIGININLTLS